MRNPRMAPDTSRHGVTPAGFPSAAALPLPLAAAERRRTLVDELTDASASLDELIRDASLLPPSADRHNDFEERAQRIAAQLLTSFRGPVRPVHPPLWQQGGKALW